MQTSELVPLDNTCEDVLRRLAKKKTFSTDINAFIDHYALFVEPVSKKAKPLENDKTLRALGFKAKVRNTSPLLVRKLDFEK